MTTTQSPLPEAKVIEKELSFPEAMKAIIVGKKITKVEWKNKEVYGFLNGEFLSLHKIDGKNYQWIISAGDLQGEDYIVL